STVLRLYPGASDVLEGAAMLLAAGVLFWVSYWLVAKAGADRWQRFIQGRVKEAMAAGSSTALAVAAFLAVYREGFETVLFYRALLGGAPAGDVMVGAGFLCGLVLLAGVWMGLARLRAPLAPGAAVCSYGSSWCGAGSSTRWRSSSPAAASSSCRMRASSGSPRCRSCRAFRCSASSRLSSPWPPRASSSRRSWWRGW